MKKIVLTPMKKFLIGLFVLLIIAYTALSVLLGFPIFFERINAHARISDYCAEIYPDITLEGTHFNPVSNSFESPFLIEGERYYLSTAPGGTHIGDPYRREQLLEDSGVRDTIDRLHRLYVEGKYYRFLSCSMSWQYDAPETPHITLRFDYGDRDNTTMPSDDEIKELLTPTVLDCVLQVEEHLPLDSLYVLYSHPDYRPEEHGMAWKWLNIPMGEETPRDETILQDVVFEER